MEIKVINNIPGVRADVQKTENGFTITVTEAGRQKLSELEPGAVFKIGDLRFIVLEHTSSGTCVIAEKFAVDEMKYGDNNRYSESALHKYCEGDFYKKVSALVGEEAIVPHIVDLTALDGTEGPRIGANVSVLTLDRYRRYRKFIPNYGDWWWLATPASYQDGYERYACCVDSNGIPYWYVCDFRGGVRPFLILKSSLLVSFAD